MVGGRWQPKTGKKVRYQTPLSELWALKGDGWVGWGGGGGLSFCKGEGGGGVKKFFLLQGEGTQSVRNILNTHKTGGGGGDPRSPVAESELKWVCWIWV